MSTRVTKTKILDILYLVYECKQTRCITWPVVVNVVLSEGSGKINRAQRDSMEKRIVTADTIKTLLITAQRITNIKYPCKTKQRSWRSHNKCEWPYRVSEALSLIQVQLHRSPVISECLQANERRTAQIHLISPVVLVRWNVEANKLPNSLQVASWCSYTWKCINLFYFRQTSWLSLPSVWW